MSPLTPQSRRRLYAAFIAWLAQATNAETDQLDALLDQLPTPGGRSVLMLVNRCLQDPVLRPQLPQNLCERLQAA